jgi:tripartite-type tricarboxylate transporter receptor subunit TctC
LADLPTVDEAGLPEFKADVWFGIVVPLVTPGEIIAKLNQELVAIMRLPDVVEQLRRQGIESMTRTPAEFAAFLRADIGKRYPAGLVPVLVDGGHALTESRIINEYLEDA